MGENHQRHFWLNLDPDGLLSLFHVRIGNEKVGPFSHLNSKLANTAFIKADDHIMPLDFWTHLPASERTGISYHRNRLADCIRVKKRKRINKYRFCHADCFHTGHTGCEAAASKPSFSGDCNNQWRASKCWPWHGAEGRSSTPVARCRKSQIENLDMKTAIQFSECSTATGLYHGPHPAHAPGIKKVSGGKRGRLDNPSTATCGNAVLL
jgi:hypothetical protein